MPAKEAGADRLVPVPTSGRIHRAERRVRFGDLHPTGRIRLDAVARYLQDLSNDDTVDAGLTDDLSWVVRRTVVEVRVPARFREQLAMATFCSGMGGRWAERRIELRGEHGAAIDAAVLWVRIDPGSGRPLPVGDQFVALYGPTAAGRQVTARLRHPAEPPTDVPPPRELDWPVRVVDLDPLGHVNNAATWAIVEEVLETAAVQPPWRAELEYRSAIELHHRVVVRHRARPHGGVELWAVDGEGRSGTFVTATVTPLAG